MKRRRRCGYKDITGVTDCDDEELGRKESDAGREGRDGEALRRA